MEGMKESYRKGIADHRDPESCVCSRKAAGEALTGAQAGYGTAQSETPSMPGNSMREGGTVTLMSNSLLSTRYLFV